MTAKRIWGHLFALSLSPFFQSYNFCILKVGEEGVLETCRYLGPSAPDIPWSHSSLLLPCFSAINNNKKPCTDTPGTQQGSIHFQAQMLVGKIRFFLIIGRVFRPLLILARGHSQFLAMWAFSMAGLLHLNQQGRESMKSPSKTEITILEGTSHPLPYPTVWKWVIGPLSYSRWRVWMPRGSNNMGIANIQQSRRTHD